MWLHMALTKELLDILSCPKCNGKLNERAGKVICKNCSAKFPIEDGVPNLLA